MTSKRFIVLTISLLSLLPLYKLVQACAGEPDPYDEYPSFFNNEVTNKPAYIPFYYQSWLKYYDDWYDAPGANLPDANIKEWADYTATSIPSADIDSFVYAFSYQDLRNLYFHLEKGAPLAMSPEATTNAFTKWFIRSKDLEALGYLMYAKQCEPLVNTGDDWEAPERDTAKMGKLLRNGLQLQKAAKKDFIRDRYNYQVIRLAFYANNPARAIDLYNTLAAGQKGRSEILARTIALKGGALYRLKQKAEAAYCYSLAFDMSDNIKITAFQSYDWAVGKDAAPVLKWCKTPHEKAVVWVMNGLHHYDYGLTSIQAAYEADPTVEGLDVVMTREINKEEERYQSRILEKERNVTASSYWYNGYSYYYNRDGSSENEQQAKQAKYLSSLNSFAQKVIADNKRADKAFWQLSASYICFMQRDLTGCKKMLAAAKSGKLNNQEQDLADVLDVIYTIRNSGKITPAVESQLLPQLQAMKKRSNQKAFRDVMNNILTTAYLQQGDSIRAIYTLAKGTGYADASYLDLPGSLMERISIARLQDARSFLQNNQKTGFERWLVDSTRYTVAGLEELEGTKYIRQFAFEKAVNVLKNLSDSAALPDPFVTHISDQYELEPEDTNTLYTKLSYAQKMAALQKKIKATPDDANALFTYAAGLYSISYYGKSTYAYTYYRSSTDELAYFNSDSRKATPAYVQEYYGVMTAEQLFAKSAGITTDPTLKAKALFMAARCWQKRCETAKASSYYDGDMLKQYYSRSLSNPYFVQFKKEASTTKFYQEALNTCGYFKDYATRNK